MSEPKLGWDTGTTPSKYTLAMRETLIKMCDDKDKEIAKLREALEKIRFIYASGFEFYDIDSIDEVAERALK